MLWFFCHLLFIFRSQLSVGIRNDTHVSLVCNLTILFLDLCVSISENVVTNLINGEILTEKRNGGYGYIRGLELDLEGKISSAITMRFYHVKMQSDIASYPDASETRRKAPHSRLMPDNTKLIFSYDSPMAKITASLTHVEDQQDLSFGDMLDTQRIPPGGTPGYDTLDLKFSHRLIFINAETWAHVAIENVTDENPITALEKS